MVLLLPHQLSLQPNISLFQANEYKLNRVNFRSCPPLSPALRWSRSDSDGCFGDWKECPCVSCFAWFSNHLLFQKCFMICFFLVAPFRVILVYILKCITHLFRCHHLSANKNVVTPTCSYHALGNVYEQQGQKQRAFLTFKTATEVDPNHADAYFNMGTGDVWHVTFDVWRVTCDLWLFAVGSQRLIDNNCSLLQQLLNYFRIY